MREIIARTICGVMVCLVLGLSWVFASRHNPRSGVDAPKQLAPAEIGRDLDVERGREVYAERSCASCHSIAGRGNPRLPLDGVGARRNADELRHYVTATGLAASELPNAVVGRKASYRQMPEDEMAPLLKYLSSLTGAR